MPNPDKPELNYGALGMRYSSNGCEWLQEISIFASDNSQI
jgi:hypothetical protein